MLATTTRSEAGVPLPRPPLHPPRPPRSRPVASGHRDPVVGLDFLARVGCVLLVLLALYLLRAPRLEGQGRGQMASGAGEAPASVTEALTPPNPTYHAIDAAP